CVRYSAEDAVREGFAVVVIEDACRGIDVQGSIAATRSSLAALRVDCISVTEISVTRATDLHAALPPKRSDGDSQSP
ncbi:MAG: hypothetical protein WBD11_08625, partial [Xanthobacteraceae bacterium]